MFQVPSYRFHQSGQAIVLAVLALGGIVLSATAVAGLLMTHQIRQTTDAANSAKAVFAADAGIECGLYNALKSGSCPLDSGNTFLNDAKYEVKVEILPNTTSTSITSKGIAGNSRRAFLLLLE